MHPSPSGQCPEQEKRTAKALRGLADGSLKVQLTGVDTWRVQNGDKDPYVVVRAASAWACDCPDWSGRCVAAKLRCKHIEAVRLSPTALPSSSTSIQIQKETIHLMNDDHLTPAPDPQAALTAITLALAAPFPAMAVNWKPQAVSKDKTRALAVAYIDARDVMDRLDEVVGAFNWQVEHVEACGQLVTRIGIKNPVNDEWVWKSDLGFVGGSESTNEDTQVKAIKGTPSDGLKRAGVEWGIGRYLYKLPKSWVEFDADKKALKSTPVLPLWAIPEADRHPKGKPSATSSSNGNGHHGSTGASPTAATAIPPRTPPPPNGNGNGKHGVQVQSNGDELSQARALIMTMGSEAVKGKPLGELGRDVWDFLATGQFNGDEALALQRAARLLLGIPI